MPQIKIGDEVVHIHSGQSGTIREIITVDGAPVILVNDSTGQSLDTGFHPSDLELIPHKETSLIQIIEAVKTAAVPFALIVQGLKNVGEGEQIEVGHTGRYVLVSDFIRLERLYYNARELEAELELEV